MANDVTSSSAEVRNSEAETNPKNVRPLALKQWFETWTLDKEATS